MKFITEVDQEKFKTVSIDETRPKPNHHFDSILTQNTSKYKLDSSRKRLNKKFVIDEKTKICPLTVNSKFEDFLDELLELKLDSKKT